MSTELQRSKFFSNTNSTVQSNVYWQNPCNFRDDVVIVALCQLLFKIWAQTLPKFRLFRLLAAQSWLIFTQQMVQDTLLLCRNLFYMSHSQRVFLSLKCKVQLWKLQKFNNYLNVLFCFDRTRTRVLIDLFYSQDAKISSLECVSWICHCWISENLDWYSINLMFSLLLISFDLKISGCWKEKFIFEIVTFTSSFHLKMLLRFPNL